MILSFKIKINGTPTYFVEKIHKSFSIKEVNMIAGLDPSIHYPKDYNFIVKGKCEPKLHTIRTDEKNRWKKGVLIDFFYQCETKKHVSVCTQNSGCIKTKNFYDFFAAMWSRF